MLNIKDLSQPQGHNNETYEQALRLGLEIFDRKDPGRAAEKAGAEFVGRSVVLPYLNKALVFNVDTHRFSFLKDEQSAPMWLAILVVHYLNNADGGVPTGKLKHFREFKDCQFYEPAFNQSTKRVLAQHFGADTELMRQAGIKLGGKEIPTGDVGIELSYFPLLPITCILWKGDEEFPAEGSVLFDETAERFLSPEDMAVAGQMAVLEMIKASQV